jgi:hypothetical protein
MPYKTVDGMGRPTGKLRTRRNKLQEVFVPHFRSMLESPAWAALSITARRILDRLELEHLSHGGVENGKLVCTYDDFVKYGAGRKYIKPAILQLRQLGFIEVTQWGRQAVGDGRVPSKYRLTYVPTVEPCYQATHEWRRFKYDEAVRVALQKAENELHEGRQRAGKRRTKNKIRVVKRSLASVVKRVLGAQPSPTKSQGKTGGGTLHELPSPVVKRELLSISAPPTHCYVISAHPGAMEQFYGVGRGRYVLSTNPRALQPYGSTKVAPKSAAAA